MDIPGVNDGWDLEVNPLIQEMAHREEEYFNPQEVSRFLYTIGCIDVEVSFPEQRKISK